MQYFETVGRGAAAEIVSFEKGDLQAGGGEPVEDGGAVDAAADDDGIEIVVAEQGKVSFHGQGWM